MARQLRPDESFQWGYRETDGARELRAPPAGLGGIDGGGNDELLIGAPGESTGRSGCGATYLLSGAAPSGQ